MTRFKLWIVAGVIVGIPILNAQSSSPNTQIQSWTSPQSGWLYVVDSEFERQRDRSRVWLVDPAEGQVRGAISAGYAPDIALSPGGDRLYVVSGTSECSGRSACDELAVIDTARGVVLQTAPMAARVRYKVYLSTSWMAVSASGGGVFIRKWDEPVPSEGAAEALAVFDVNTGQFAPEEIHLGQCGLRSFAPATEDLIRLYCGDGNELRTYRPLARGNATLEASIGFPKGKRLFARHVYSDVGAVAFVPASDRGGVFAVNGDGSVLLVETETLALPKLVVAGAQDMQAYAVHWGATAGHSKLYVGFGSRTGNGPATEVRAFDTATWQPLVAALTSFPFVSAVGSADGSTIYAMARDHGRVLTIDTAAMREIRTMRVGRAPSRAIVAP
jgi:hypothetical protein